MGAYPEEYLKEAVYNIRPHQFRQHPIIIDSENCKNHSLCFDERIQKYFFKYNVFKKKLW